MPNQVPKATQKSPTKHPVDDDSLFNDSHPSISSSATQPASSLSPSIATARATKEEKSTAPASTVKPKKKESKGLFGSSLAAEKSDSDDDLFSSGTSTSKSAPILNNSKAAEPVASTTLQKEAKKPAKIGGGKKMFGGSADDDDDLFAELKSSKLRSPDSEESVSVKKAQSPTLIVPKKKKPVCGVSVFGGTDPFGVAVDAGMKSETIKASTASSSSSSSSSFLAHRQDELRGVRQSPVESLFSSKKLTVRQGIICC